MNYPKTLPRGYQTAMPDESTINRKPNTFFTRNPLLKIAHILA